MGVHSREVAIHYAFRNLVTTVPRRESHTQPKIACARLKLLSMGDVPSNVDRFRRES